MMRFPWRRSARTCDPEALMAEIRRAWSDDYSPDERYADFRRVLLGSEGGKRVLHQILAWSRLWGTSFDPNPNIAAFREGERNIGLRIIAALENEPRPRPKKQTSKPIGD